MNLAEYALNNKALVKFFIAVLVIGGSLPGGFGASGGIGSDGRVGKIHPFDGGYR